MSMFGLYNRATNVTIREGSSFFGVVDELVIISEGKVHIKFHNKDNTNEARTELYDFSEITGSMSNRGGETIYRNRASGSLWLRTLRSIYWNDNLPLPGGYFDISIYAYKDVRSLRTDYKADHRYEYPLFCVWPDNKPQKLSELGTPDATIRPTAQTYTDLDENQIDKKREYIIHKTSAEANHAQTIVDYGDDPKVVEACHLWLAYLYNRAFHIWDDANINNTTFWPDFLEIQSLDEFLLDYDYASLTDRASESMKDAMYEGFTVYDYADGTFTVKRGPGVTPSPNNSVMALGSQRNHRWVRQRLGLEPRKSLRDATLSAFGIAEVGSTDPLSISPAFASDVFSYTLVVSELETYELGAVPNHNLARIDFSDENVGDDRMYHAKVVSEDGEVENTYTVLVTVASE